MALNQLIAQGGRNIKSPVQRYMETKGQMAQEEQNRLAQMATRQNMAAQSQQMGFNQQNQQAAMAQAYAKSITPIIESVNKAPDKQAAYQQALPLIQQTAQQMGIPTDKLSPQWDQTKADSLISQFGKKPEGSFVNAMTPSGSIVPSRTSGGIMYDPQGKPQPTWVKAPSRQETGEPNAFAGTKSQLGKITVERTEAEDRLKKQLRGYDTIEELIKNPGFVGGIAGDTVSLINSASAQFRQATGVDPIINDGRVNLKQIDRDSNLFKRIRKAGVISDLEEAATVELAYILAKGNDKGGRVTDKDYQVAKKMMGAGADKASRLSVLDYRRKEDIQSFNDTENTLAKRYKDQGYQPKLYESKKPEKKVATFPTDKEVDDMVEKYAD